MSQQAPSNRLLRVNDVRKIVPVSRTQWLRLVARGDAPAALRLSERTTVWRESEVLEWIATREATRDFH